jgi:uncharacterized membrane protein
MRTETEITIAAPMHIVWAATLDVENWPQWTPTVTRVAALSAGLPTVGSRYRVRQPLQAEAVWEVAELEVGKRFVWKKRGRLIHFIAVHELEPAGESVRNRLVLEARGAAAMLGWPVLGPLFKLALIRENAGLKSHCERRFRDDV